MDNQDLQFQRAEYAQPSVAVADPSVAQPLQAEAGGTLVRAVLAGLVAAAVCAPLYGGFTYLTHWDVGYIAIGVAYVVAKAMMLASRGVGGRPYQIAALVLVLLSVMAGDTCLLYWNLRHEGTVLPLNGPGISLLLRYGPLSRFTELHDSVVSGLIGLFILFIALRAAWRMTSGTPGAASQPFAR